jgi:hypothetical protein
MIMEHLWSMVCCGVLKYKQKPLKWVYYALLSHGVKPTWGFHKVKSQKNDLAARSRLPTLERGRGSSWEPRD